MGFRRYGGDIETKGLGGRARLTWLGFPLGTAFGILGFAAGGFIGLFVGISIGVAILLFANRLSILPQNPIRTARYKHHCKYAIKYYQEGNLDAARESLFRLKMYGEVPDSLREIEKALNASDKADVKFERTKLENDKEADFIFPITFSMLIGIDLAFGGPLHALVGWVFLLPNHTYLYVSSILPLITLFMVRVAKEKLPEKVFFFGAAILIYGGAMYILAGAAQLWRMPVIPFGIITLVMGAVLTREGILILRSQVTLNRTNLKYFLSGFFCFFLASTIYVQPWKLVINMPNVSDVELENLDLSGYQFNLVTFKNVNMKNVDFSGASLIGIDFKDVDLTRASFLSAKVDNSSFDKVNLSKADFSRARVYQTDFESSNLSGSRFSNTTIGRTHIKNSLLCNADFVGNMGSFYGWSGSTVNRSSIPTGGFFW